jgi:exopolyphosphatase/pppGpp-phosphohydrolase
MKIPGLPERRADVIVAGAILLEEIFLAMGIQKMKVSPFALREGVIVDTLARSVVNYRPGVNIRHTSVINLAKKFNTDQRMRAAQHSAQLAKVLTYMVSKSTPQNNSFRQIFCLFFFFLVPPFSLCSCECLSFF